ncbi:hypothetical protein AVM02_10470 [Brucella anthropi]|uniref:chromate transporter n=1 Tax=Brucella anthropi TaxID=529 RepID=UPI003986574D
MDDGKLLNLILLCIPLSLVSFGGGQTIVASLQHQLVDSQHMLTSERFTDLYAISRSAPGPGTLIVALIGWDIGGLFAAFLAACAIFLPSSVLLCIVGSYWERVRTRPWGIAVEKGLAPVALGLIFAGIYTVSSSARLSPLEIATIALAAFLLMMTRIGAYPLLGAIGVLYFCLGNMGFI